MSSSVRSYLVLAVILTVSLPGWAESIADSGAASRLKITLLVYNYGQLAPSILAKAESKTSQIFRQVGIEARWVDSALCLSTPNELAECQEAISPTGFSLRILSESMGKLIPRRLVHDNQTLGLSLPCTEAKPGCVANVLYHRVERLARNGNATRPEILAHATAHEIAHLLLGSAHSATGIMRANWDPQDLQKIAKGNLFFTPQQAELLRVEVVRRSSTGLRPSVSRSDH